MISVLRTYNRLCLRYSRWNIAISVLLHTSMIIFLQATKLYNIGFIMLTPTILFVTKENCMTHYSVDTQSTMPIWGITKSIRCFVLASFFEASSVPMIITSLLVAVHTPENTPIFIGYSIMMLSVMPTIFTLMKRIPIRIFINMLFSLPSCIFASFYAGSGRETLVQANEFLVTHQTPLGTSILCASVFVYLLSVLLIRSIVMQRLFRSPEVVAKNTSRKKQQ